MKPEPVLPELRVLQVVLSLNPGGTERLVMDLIDRLGNRIPMAVCCLDEIGTWGEELRQTVPISALGRKPGFSPSLGRALAKAAHDHRATLIHAHQYSPFVYSCLSRAWRPATPIVFTEHGRASDAPPSAKRALANRVLARFPAAVFAVSEDLKRFMVAEGFPADRIGVCYNGVAPGKLPSPDERRAIRSELGVPDGTMLAGTIARLDPVKSLGTFIDALALVAPDRAVQAVIVGDGAERARLEALAAERGVAPRVRFLGERRDARRFLAGCDVFVNSSTSEGVSLTILEAMSAGLPIVATRVGGTPEVVSGDCGLLVPARDPAALASALRACGDDPARAEQMGRAARARVEAQFTIDRMVQDYEAVYRSTAPPNPEPGTRNPEPGT